MDLAFDRGQQPQIDEIELVAPAGAADRLGAVNGIGVPARLIAGEQRRQIGKLDLLKCPGRVDTSDLPDGHIVMVDDEQQRRTKCPMLIHEVDSTATIAIHHRKRRGPIGWRRSREGDEGHCPGRVCVDQYVREGVVAHDRFRAIAGVVDGPCDAVDGVHIRPPRAEAAALIGIGGKRSDTCSRLSLAASNCSRRRATIGLSGIVIKA